MSPYTVKPEMSQDCDGGGSRIPSCGVFRYAPCLWTLLFSEPAKHRQASMIVGGNHTMVLKN